VFDLSGIKPAPHGVGVTVHTVYAYGEDNLTSLTKHDDIPTVS